MAERKHIQCREEKDSKRSEESVLVYRKNSKLREELKVFKQ